MAIAEDRNTLYVGLSHAAIDLRATGSIPRPGARPIRVLHDAGGCADLSGADRTGRYMLCAYYQGGDVCGISDRRRTAAIAAHSIDKQANRGRAHAIATDPSNRFAFVPSYRPHSGQCVGAAEK